MSLVNIVCFQVQVSAWADHSYRGVLLSVIWVYVSCEHCVFSGTGLCAGWSLVQRSPTECHMPECDHEASIMRRPWPTRGCCAMRDGGGTSFLHKTFTRKYTWHNFPYCCICNVQMLNFLLSSGILIHIPSFWSDSWNCYCCQIGAVCLIIS